MYSNFKEHLQSTIDEIREAGLYRSERVIAGPQDERIEIWMRRSSRIEYNNGG